MKNPSFLLRAFASLLAGLLMASAGAASADTTVTTTGLQSAGVLKLTLAGSDEFRWVNPPASDVFQTISDDRCLLVLSPTGGQPGALVSLTAGNKSPGFNSQKNWIGVREQSRGVDCGRVSPGQKLVLDLKTGALAGYAVKHTILQVNAKKNAVIKAHLTLKGGNSKDFYLYTGLSATAAQGAPPDNGDSVQYCKAGVVDSSPDSSSNCSGSDLWEFDWNYDTAELSTVVPAGNTAGVSGEWSLAGPSPSEFQLVKADGILDCSANKTAAAGSTGDPKVTVVRQPNIDPTACVPVPYSLSSSCTEGVCATDFRYDPLNQGVNLAFVFHWEWPIIQPVPGNGSVDDIGLTQQTFDNGATYPLDLCPEATAVYDDSGNFVRMTGVSDQDGGTNGTHAGCLIRRDIKAKDTGGALLIEDAWVQGDYTATRR